MYTNRLLNNGLYRVVGARKRQFRGRGGATIGRRETPIGRPAGYGLEAGDTRMIFGTINKRLVPALTP